MDLITFIGTVVVVTASGALAPGPLSFAILMHGSKGGAWAGFSCAIGHMLVELPLILALALGLLAAADQPLIRSTIGIVGGIGLIVFGVLQIHETLRNKPEVEESAHTRILPTSSIMLGAALTGLNPYFILWWLTIGSVLIIQALAFAALMGVLVMYVAHVWIDYAFLTSLAHFGRKGRTIVGSKYYKIVLISFGVILTYYGTSFILAAIR
jgi:threonine/homoserine/homoserine lactone efflux protein